MNSTRRSSLLLAALAGVAGLFLAAVSTQAQTVVFTNFASGESYNPGWVQGVRPNAMSAFEFTPTASGALDSITAALLWEGTGANSVTLSLYMNAAGELGTFMESITKTGLPDLQPLVVKPLTPFVSVKHPELTAGSSYFLLASTTDGVAQWCRNTRGDTGTLLVMQQVYAPVSTLTGEARGAFSVSVSPIPEPSTCAVLCGVSALGLVAWRRRAKR